MSYSNKNLMQGAEPVYNAESISFEDALAYRGDNKEEGFNNGGSTDYYKLPENAKDLQDLIEHKNMCWNIANIFKSCYRIGSQEHSSVERDLNKIEYFVKRQKALLRELQEQDNAN